MADLNISYIRAGEPARQPGEELLAALHSLLQNVKVHQGNNILVINCIQRFMDVAGKCFEETDEVSIQISKGKFYINEKKLPYRRDTAFLIGQMLKFLESRNVQGLRFYPALLVATSEQVVAFARHLNQAIRQKDSMDWLVSRLEEEKLHWVILLRPEVRDSFDASLDLGMEDNAGRATSRDGTYGLRTEQTAGAGAAEGETVAGAGPDGAGEEVLREPGGEERPSGAGFRINRRGEANGGDDGIGRVEVPGRRSPRRLYAYALEAMREVAGKISGNQRVGIRNAVRVVQNMVEEITIQEKPLLLAMSTIRVYDDYTFTHSVNVAILSMIFGRKIGVNKETMECLGICGLFHDLGKVLVPEAIFKKAEPLTEEEFGEIRKHPLNSTRLILRLRATPRRKAGIIMPPLEHHLGFDLKGYPQIGWEKPQTLCGRILAICDYFDALTSLRVYRHEAYSADRALGLMLSKSGSHFDPLLLKVFINLMGVYPIGTLLELDNGEIGLVCRSPDTQVMSRPWVLLLHPDGSGGFVKGEEVNLADQDKEGFYFRSVASSANPMNFNIQPAEYLT